MTFLPDNILRLMSKDDRLMLGKSGMTAEEGRARAVARSEKEIQNQIASLLDLRDIPYCRPRMDRKSTIQRGWPDFTFCYRNMPIVVEVKAEGGELSDEQMALHRRLKASGWCVFVVRSATEFRDQLTGLDLIGV